MNKTPKIIWLEPVIFVFLGLLHLHRVWAFIDRERYADFWLFLYNSRDWFYFVLMGIMAALCISGILVFSRIEETIIGGAGFTSLAAGMLFLIYSPYLSGLRCGKTFCIKCSASQIHIGS